MTKKIIRHLAALAIVLLPAFSVKAQVGEHRSDFAVGVNAGFNMNSISFVPTVKQANRNGFTGGFTLRYNCEKYFKTLCSLQAEVNFAQLGWKEVTDGNTDYTYKRTINYVQVPLLTRMAWGKEQRGALFYFILGPQLGFCMGESEQRPADWDGFVNSRPNSKLTPMYDMKVENKLDYGLTGGLGLELNTKIGHFLLEGRYYFGLGNIYKDTKKDIFSRSAYRDIVVKATYLVDLVKTKP